jgi:hypothetical protein
LLLDVNVAALIFLAEERRVSYWLAFFFRVDRAYKLSRLSSSLPLKIIINPAVLITLMVFKLA